MISGMKLIPRAIEPVVRQRLQEQPAVVLLGPCQVGKTTLARQIAEERGEAAIYLDLERPADLRRLDDADAYLRAQRGKLVVIDEIHRAAGLFAILRGVIDERRRRGHRHGQFLLLGSASIDLMRQASETLAGRVAYLDIAPFTAAEATAAGYDMDAAWVRGGFPESLLAKDDRTSLRWRLEFIRSYLERDVPMFAPRLPAQTIGRLWTMLANGQGSLLNQSRLASGVGVSAPAVGRYIDLLVDLQLVRRLPPWSSNLGKRLVRSPKTYVRDSGVLHALLELETWNDIIGHPVVGPSWEGFIIENLVAAASGRWTPYFYRTEDGAEIDLLFERAGRPSMAIEVKRASAPDAGKGFRLASDDLKVKKRYVVYPGRERYPMGGDVIATPLSNIVDELAA
jgi:predicted AAA+ superfamily ATPase